MDWPVYWVRGIEVSEVDGTPQEFAVHDQREPHVQDDVVVYGQAQQQAYQLVLTVTLQRAGVDPVLLCALVVEKQP